MLPLIMYCTEIVILMNCIVEVVEPCSPLSGAVLPSHRREDQRKMTAYLLSCFIGECKTGGHVWVTMLNCAKSMVTLFDGLCTCIR